MSFCRKSVSASPKRSKSTSSNSRRGRYTRYLMIGKIDRTLLLRLRDQCCWKRGNNGFALGLLRQRGECNSCSSLELGGNENLLPRHATISQSFPDRLLIPITICLLPQVDELWASSSRTMYTYRIKVSISHI